MADYDLNPETGGGLLGGSGGGWLGNLLNFSGGRSTTADLYGDLFSKKQLAAIQQRESQAKFKGLLDVLSQAAAPSTFKKNYGQILGQVGGAMLGSSATGDAAAESALKGGLTAQQIAKLRREAELQGQISPIVLEYAKRFLQGGGSPPGAGAPAPAPVPPPGAPPGAPPPGPAPGAPVPNPAGAPVNPFAPPPIPYAGPGSASAPRPFGMSPAIDGTPVSGSVGRRDDNPDSPTYGQYVLPPTPPPGPPPGAGAGMPPVDPQQLAMMMGGGLLGAGGGGTQLPPTEGEGDALPPQDTVIPSGGGGLLDPDMVKLAALGGGSGGGRDPLDIIAQYESGGRNIMQGIVPPGGGYNPSVGRVTGPSTAQGPWMITNTTWKGAAPKVGIDPEKYPNAMSVPVEDQRRVAQRLYDERGYADWAPYNRALAREVGWKGAQYTEGSGGGSGSAPSAPPAAGGVSDKIPGVGASPQELAALDMLAEMAGMKTPFKSLLDAYYKTPGYLGTAAGAESRARKDVELKMDPLIREQTERAALRAQLALKPQLDAAIEEAKNPALEKREAAKAEIDRITKQMEQTGAASLDLTTIRVPDGQGGQMDVQATRTQAVRAAHGLAVPELGIPARRTDSPTAPTGAPIASPTGTPVLSDTQKGLRAIPVKEYEGVRAAAVKAPQAIQNTHELRRSLDAGMFTGITADWEEFYTRIADAVGIAGQDKQDKLANTQVFSANLGQEVANFISAAKWTPVSNVDLKFAQDIVGGKTLTEQSLRRLLELREKYARLSIQQHNELAKKFGPAAFGEFDPTIDLPPAYQRAPESQPSIATPYGTITPVR